MTAQAILYPRKKESFRFKVVDTQKMIDPNSTITKLEAEESLMARLGLQVEIPAQSITRVELFGILKSKLLTPRNHGVVAPIRINSEPIPGKLDMSKVRY